jgi:hypothetical protein
MKTSLIKSVAGCLTILMFLIGISPRVDAGFVPSEIIMHSQSDRAYDMQKVQKILEQKMVQQRLEALGFTKEEIQKRLNQLSDEQMHNLALNLDELKVGGALGLIIVLLVIAILVVLLIQLTGHRVIVK